MEKLSKIIGARVNTMNFVHDFGMKPFLNFGTTFYNYKLIYEEDF